jgi:hypothetical protein
MLGLGNRGKSVTCLVPNFVLPLFLDPPGAMGLCYGKSAAIRGRREQGET